MTSENREWIEARIADYCARTGIPREQYDNVPSLNEDQPGAIELLHERLGKARNLLETQTVIVPEGLPGAGKCYGELDEGEQEMISMLEIEWEDLLGDDIPEDDTLIEGRPKDRGWKY
jgi:hypothetical protein